MHISTNRAIVNLLSRLKGGPRAKAVEHRAEDDCQRKENDCLAAKRASGAEIGPLQASLCDQVLCDVGTELVVHEASKSDAVTESLKKADWVAKQEHRSKDKEDVLEHTGESEDEGGGLANLQI